MTSTSPATTPEGKNMLNQFEGCLAGVLVGDCLGYTYERVGGRNPVPTPVDKIHGHLTDIMEGNNLDSKQYTDDSSMTMSVAKFLLTGSSDSTDLAKRFVQTYDNETKNRGYGPGIRRLFPELKATNYKNPIESARGVFPPDGSFGNGAGMRAAPIALYTISDSTLNRLVDLTLNYTVITHAHPRGLAGAIFQVLAVRQGFFAGKLGKAEQNPLDILSKFEKEFEMVKDAFGHILNLKEGYSAYEEKLVIIRQLLEGGNTSWTFKDVRNKLKANASGPTSIPTAFFCFLASFDDIPSIKTNNQFVRTIELVFGLGGDTDTIGSMAAAICGAYLGYEAIPTNLIKVCEAHEKMLDLALKLCEKNPGGS